MRTTLLLAFLALLALWTWKLLEPRPVPEAVTREIGLTFNLFYVAKTLHAGVYAFLTILGTTLWPRRRWWVVAFMLLHGVGTEVGQTFVPNRTGKVTDVLIDWAGIGCGVATVWWWSVRRMRRRSGHF